MTGDIVAQIRAEAKNQTTLGQAFDMLHVAEEIERRDFVIQQMYAELKRLRKYVAALQEDRQMAGNQNAAMRAAGDQLHAWVTVNSTSGQQNRADFDKVLNAWEEACHGQA